MAMLLCAVFANAEDYVLSGATSTTTDSKATTWTFTSNELNFSISSSKGYSTGNKVDDVATIKYSRNTDFTIALPTGLTVTSVKINGYGNDEKTDAYVSKINTTEYGTTDYVLPNKTTGASTTEITGLSITNSMIIRFGGAQACAIITLSGTYEAPSVATPEFSLEAGKYDGDQTVEIKCSTDGAFIYYTTDGEDPTNESSAYTEAITISKNCTLKAIAYSGADASQIASAIYYIAQPINLSSAMTFNTFAVDGNNDEFYSNISNTSGDSYLFTFQRTSKSTTVLNLQSSGAARIESPLIKSENGFKVTVTYSTTAQFALSIGDESVNADKASEASTDGTGNTVTLSTTSTSASFKFACSSDKAACYVSSIVIEPNSSEAETVDVTLASSGWSTFSSADKAIDFATGVVGVKAYTAVYSEDNGNVTMTEFTGILKAGNGVVLIGEANGEYSLPVSAVEGTAPESNDLVAVTSATTVPCPTSAPYYYALSGGKFHPFDSEGCTFAAGKAYLKCSREYQSSGAKAIDIVFADDATAINEVSAAQKSAKIYNLQGIEVQNPTNGLYIKNGKKFIK